MKWEQVPPQQWHMLTQAVGTDTDLSPDKKAVGLKPGDILLLCSDGLTDMLTDEEIAAMLSKLSLSLVCAQADSAGRIGNPSEERLNELADFLVAEANNRGGRDNISVVLVQYA